MKEITVKTQVEFDALPEKFDDYTRIYIQAPRGAWIQVNEARENSSVVARGNSSVEAWGNSSVVAWGNSSVVARENSSVEARGNSSVVAWGNSSVEAWGNSSVVAWGNSSVVARENSSVEAWGNSSVVARGNSSVEAWENSSVVAWGNSVVRIFSALAKILLHGFSVAFLPVTINLNVQRKSEQCHVQVVKELDWFERNCVEKSEHLVLYKRVSKDFKTQEGTANETLWSIGSTPEHANWNPESGECGEGKFHACSRAYFCDEFRSIAGDRYIAVEIALADLHEWKDNPSYPHKIGFRKGKVLYECNRFGKEIKAVPAEKGA